MAKPAATSGASLAAFVRAHDRDRYQTALFAPGARREALFALYAFNYEVARVRESVREPMLGQIRLQWWREVIDAAYSGAPTRRHEVAEPLTATIRDYGLTRQYFDRLIDAREHDLADEPFSDMPALEAYAEATSATLLWLAQEIFGARDEPAMMAAREAGIGYALAGLLRAMPFHAATGRCVIPSDLAVRTRLNMADYAARRTTDTLRGAVAEVADTASRHLNASKQYRGYGTSTLLSAVIARHYLSRLARAAHDPFAPLLITPDVLQAWRLLAARLTSRF